MSDRVIFGADAKEYFDVVARMEQKLNDLAVTTERSGKRMAGGLSLAGDNKVSRNLGNLVRDLSSGASVSDVFANSVYRVGESIKGAFGLAVGVGVGFALFEALQKARKEAEDLRAAIDRVTASGSGPASSNSIDELTNKLAESRKQLEALIASEKPGIGQALRDILFTPDNTPWKNISLANAEREQQANRLIEAQRDAMEKLAEKAKELARIGELRLQGSEREAALAEIRAKWEERIAAATKAGPNQNPAMAESLKKLRDQEIESANRKFDLDARALAHAADLAAIEKQGLATQDETLARLESELAFRRQIAAEAKKAGDFKGAAVADVNVAKAEADLQKFQRERAFNDEQALKAAKSATEELRLQANGQNFLANVEKIRQTAEEKIAAAIHDGKLDLAAQAAAQGAITLNRVVGQQQLRTPAQIAADDAAARQAQFESTVGERLIAMLRQDVVHGAKLDPAQQKILDAANAIRDAVKDPKAPKDTPELAELKTLNKTASAIAAKIGAGTTPTQPASGAGGAGSTGNADPRQTNTTLSQPHDWSDFDKAFHDAINNSAKKQQTSGEEESLGMQIGRGIVEELSKFGAVTPEGKLAQPGDPTVGGGPFGGLGDLDFSPLQSLSSILAGTDFSPLASLKAAITGADFSGLSSFNGVSLHVV